MSNENVNKKKIRRIIYSVLDGVLLDKDGYPEVKYTPNMKVRVSGHGSIDIDPEEEIGIPLERKISKLEYLKECAFCSTEFWGRKNQKYCTNSCKSMAYRKRQKSKSTKKDNPNFRK